MRSGTRYDPLPFYLVHLDVGCGFYCLVEPSLMYLRPPVIGNFKEPPNPNKAKPLSAAEKREGNSKAHLALVRQLPCCICHRAPPSDCHHLKIKRERGVGLRATDQWTVPLCREHHIEIEKAGTTEAREVDWFIKRGISCYVLSRALWNAPRDLESYQKRLLSHRETKP